MNILKKIILRFIWMNATDIVMKILMAMNTTIIRLKIFLIFMDVSKGNQ